MENDKIPSETYLRVKQTVILSKVFASGKHNGVKELPAYKSITSKLCTYVDDLIDEIISTERKVHVLEESDNIENKEEQFIKTNNNILERFYQNLEAVCNMSDINDDCGNIGDNQNIPAAAPRASKEDGHVVAGVAAVRERVDDSADGIWVPRIKTKTNGIVPLELKLIYDEQGNALKYENPYKTEIHMYHPPPVLIKAEPTPIPFPPPMKNTMFTYVDTESKLEKLVSHLQEVNEIAVDLEHNSYRSYEGITCLIQISTNEGDYIIDALALKDHLHKLNDSFTDPQKIKILHGADMDVLWLQRDFGVYIVGLFDTYRAAKLLRLEGCSLKALLNEYCQVNTDKKYQTADWRIRPLPQDMVKYARMDTHYLIYIWKRMKNDILKNGLNDEQLIQVFDDSRLVCEKTYTLRKVDDNSFIKFYRSNRKKEWSWSPRQMTALQMLYKWRDSYAKELDESPAYVLPNEIMLKLANRLPGNLKSVIECYHCNPYRIPEKHKKIFEIIKMCLDMSEEATLEVSKVIRDCLPLYKRRFRSRHRILDLRPKQHLPSAMANDEPVAGPDSGPDPGPGASPYAGPDARPDAGPDSGPDPGPDAGLYAGPDARPDARPDAGPDSGPYAGPDARPDAGPDAGPYAGPDAGANAFYTPEEKASESHKTTEEFAVKKEQNKEKDLEGFNENKEAKESPVAGSSVHEADAGTQKNTKNKKVKRDKELAGGSQSDARAAEPDRDEQRSVPTPQQPSTHKKNIYKYTNPNYKSFYNSKGKRK